jgi:hypothetical protein
MVKYIFDKTGRFPLRPHYQPDELDHECEQVITAFFCAKNNVVEFPLSTDDLTVLIEKRVSYLDVYADLSGSNVKRDKIES